MGYREIHWTERSEDHIARHGITPKEVEQALFTRPRFEAPGRDESTLIYGTTDAGRYVLIVAVDSTVEPDAWYIATTRDMTASKKRPFIQKAR
ncbi:hypothetical protein ACFHYQ_21300 [Sphaerimonospora cavernae]|uniref:BrnT family toxin n=1 Tax=Sphaerimonospora cavernae TaxID=1740611 RepID=A0ABV6U9H8_9ACTN